ncbi:hypothetical protein BTR14_18490 [Rhizobium rhizosphaerae]|uniref:Uncharacterized protein n=2 Tax=Xaviernesmea rhizosphaerae TaxID=1672749 RepID=A0ABX3P8L9_9HYPH|nr:hypothetical protein BTR14_18490 [Xaviernesmea rhizosphaerae]
MSAPLLFGLHAPKVTDIPPGATIKPGCLLLHISTMPVFGQNRDETRFYNFPVYLPSPFNTPSQKNALLAFEYVRATCPTVRKAVKELQVLARTPASRAYARQHPEIFAK